MFLMTTIRSSFEALSSLSTQSNNLKRGLSISSLEKETPHKYCMVSLNKKQISKLNITKKNADEIECHILVLSLPFFILLFLFLFWFKRSIKCTFHLKMSLVNEMERAFFLLLTMLCLHVYSILNRLKVQPRGLSGRRQL